LEFPKGATLFHDRGSYEYDQFSVSSFTVFVELCIFLFRLLVRLPSDWLGRLLLSWYLRRPHWRVIYRNGSCIPKTV